MRRLARSYARTGAVEFWPTSAVAEIGARVLGQDGALVDDFLIEEGDDAVHVLNAALRPAYATTQNA